MDIELSSSASESEALAVQTSLKEEIDDSAYQVTWNRTMDQGRYNHPSTYESVKVLLLSWAQNSNDMKTSEEVNRLKSVFEKRFKYQTTMESLDNNIKQKLQVQLWTKVANFVNENDGPNTLLIVYYAGHGRPGKFYGDLEIFGKTSPNDEKKRVDTIVWNKTEKVLEDAEADILELFDCCHAGQLGLRGQPRLFEFLAACGPTGSTRAPGEDSFTSALIHGLEELVEARPDGRFTTVELLQHIQEDAPYFPKDQTPEISDRQKNNFGGRIVLHPLLNESPIAQSAPQKNDLETRHTVTLLLDYGAKPSIETIQSMGYEFNTVFERRLLGVNRIRWGGLQCRQDMIAHHVKSFINGIDRKRKTREGIISNRTASEVKLSPNLPFTPGYTSRSSDRLSTESMSPKEQNEDFVAGSIKIIKPRGESPESLTSEQDSEEEEHEIKLGRRKRLRRSSKQG